MPLYAIIQQRVHGTVLPPTDEQQNTENHRQSTRLTGIQPLGQ